MAESMKAIKTRIKSVENTKQITKAMELVATSKLRRAKEKSDKLKPYLEMLFETLDVIMKNNRDFSSPYCKDNGSTSSCYIVIAGDRGLAGGYNNNLFKSVPYKTGDIIMPIGKKALEYFEKKDVTVLSREYMSTEDISIRDCSEIAEIVSNSYKNAEFSKLYIAYTEFVNVLTQTPHLEDILPVVSNEIDKEKPVGLVSYEGSAEAVFNRMIPQYISGLIYGGVGQSLASELSARRNAMQSANKNADEMISNLSLSYNRARQAAITQELTEIVAGSEN